MKPNNLHDLTEANRFHRGGAEMERHGSPESLRRYLLGDLEEDQREKIEAELLTDQKLFDAISEVRDEIIDDYAFDELCERDRKLFDTNFALNPERLHKLRLATALARYTDANRGKVSAMHASAPLSLTQRFLELLERRRLAAAITFAIVLLAIGYGGWRAYDRYELKRQVEEVRTRRLQVEQYLAKLNTQDLSARSSSMSFLTLRPLLRESNVINKARISVGIELLQLTLEANESNFQVYRAEIETSEGIPLYSVENLKPQLHNGTTVVILHLPSKLLPAGTYEIHLQGISADQHTLDIGRYPFQILFV